jgi:RNA polymerase sigma-70 factor (ECF subfamily)
MYDRAVPQVFGYLLPRCGSTALAEDLTAETFMTAVDSAERGAVPDLSVGWLIGVARHKLVDYWRQSERERRNLEGAVVTASEADDPWEEVVDVDAVHSALAQLSGPHRMALTLRYLDGLSVAEVAECVGRSLHATETLLARARATLRRVYLEEYGHDS